MLRRLFSRCQYTDSTLAGWERAQLASTCADIIAHATTTQATHATSIKHESVPLGGEKWREFFPDGQTLSTNARQGDATTVYQAYDITLTNVMREHYWYAPSRPVVLTATPSTDGPDLDPARSPHVGLSSAQFFFVRVLLLTHVWFVQVHDHRGLLVGPPYTGAARR